MLPFSLLLQIGQRPTAAGIPQLAAAAARALGRASARTARRRLQRAHACTYTAPGWFSSITPIADVGIVAISAWTSIGTVTVDIHITMLSGLLILIRVIPWILGQAIEIRAFPVRCFRGSRRLRDQRLQALFAARVAVVVELVHAQRGSHALQILLDADDARLARPLHHARHDDRGKDAEDDDDDEDLDEGEAALGAGMTRRSAVESRDSGFGIRET